MNWQELITTYPGFTITMMLMGFWMALGIVFLIWVRITIQQSEQALREFEKDKEYFEEITEGKEKKGGLNQRATRPPEPGPPPQLPPKTGGCKC